MKKTLIVILSIFLVVLVGCVKKDEAKQNQQTIKKTIENQELKHMYNGTEKVDIVDQGVEKQNIEDVKKENKKRPKK